MPSDLLDSLNRLVTPSVVRGVAVHFGEPESAVAKGFTAAFPSILGALTTKAGNPDAFRALAALITNRANDSSMLEDPRRLLAMAPSSPIARLGADFLSALFGPRRSTVGQSLATTAGLRGATGASLLGLAAPLVMGTLGNRMRTGGLDAGGLANLLLAQCESILRAVPSGLTSALGLGDTSRLLDLRVAAPHPARGFAWLWPGLAALALLAVLMGLQRSRRVDTATGAVRQTTTDLATAAQRASPEVTTYGCDDGTKLAVAFDKAAGTAQVELDNGNEIVLPQAEAGSGFFYTNGKYGLRGKGEEARWEVGRKAPVMCKVVR
jgi:membrane-bound inhibitor of C-type lysozyme